MNCRNRLWKPTTTSKKHPEKERAGEVKILNLDGTIKQVIALSKIEPLQSHEPYIINERYNERYIEWREAILKRDRQRCVLCQCKQWLQVHHIIRWADDEKGRYDLKNGVVLCIPCHNKHHGLHKNPFPDNITEKLKQYIDMLYG